MRIYLNLIIKLNRIKKLIKNSLKNVNIPSRNYIGIHEETKISNFEQPVNVPTVREETNQDMLDNFDEINNKKD